jgi:hypothetical protein
MQRCVCASRFVARVVMNPASTALSPACGSRRSSCWLAAFLALICFLLAVIVGAQKAAQEAAHEGQDEHQTRARETKQPSCARRLASEREDFSLGLGVLQGVSRGTSVIALRGFVSSLS